MPAPLPVVGRSVVEAVLEAPPPQIERPYKPPTPVVSSGPYTPRVPLLSLSVSPISVPAWRQNAVAVSESDGPMVTIILDDLGMDRFRTRRAFDLSGPLTLAFLPYARHLLEITAEARQKGHELLVHVPMEPENSAENPGPQALLTSLSETEIRRRLNQALDSFSGHVGFNNHMGSRFTANRRLMSIILQEASRRGLLFVDSRTTAHPAARLASFNPHLPLLSRDVFLDHDPTPQAIAAQLRQLEKLALRRGYAIGIGHPYNATLSALAAWLPSLKEKGIRLVPVSALALQQTRIKDPEDLLLEAHDILR